jgi:hypothetical protein
MVNSAASIHITRCLDNLSRAGVGTTRSGATLSDKGLEWLNSALYRVSKKHDFRELVRLYQATTIASIKTYTTPVSYKSIKSIRLIDGLNSYKLIAVAPREFDRFIANPAASTTGRPLWYALYGNNIELYPVPDAAYTLYMRNPDWPATITVSSTLIDYSPDKDTLIVADMTASGFRYLQMYEDAMVWDKEFVKLLKEATDDDDDEPDMEYVGLGFDSALQEGQPQTQEPWNSPWHRIVR